MYFVKYIGNYKNITKNIESVYNLHTHHYYALSIYSNYLTEQLINKGYFTSLSQNNIDTYKSYNKNLFNYYKNELHNTFEHKISIEKLYTYGTAKNEKTIFYSKNNYTSELRTFSLSNKEIWVSYRENLLNYDQNDDTLVKFMQNNFLQNVNDYILINTRILDSEVVNEIDTTNFLNIGLVSLISVYFISAWVLFYFLSNLIRPCVTSILDGFNYIKQDL